VCGGTSSDLDDDGRCDALDRCVSTGPIGRARLSLSRLDAPPGDDRLRFRAAA